MPLLFEFQNDNDEYILSRDPRIASFFSQWLEASKNTTATFTTMLPLVQVFAGTTLILRPVSGNWLIMEGRRTGLWPGHGHLSGRFLTEIPSADLHRFFPLLEATRKSGKASLVRHCLDNGEGMTFWDSLIVRVRYHELVDEPLVLLVSVQRDVGREAIHHLFEHSPIAQLVVLPLDNSSNGVSDAYIVEANKRARDVAAIDGMVGGRRLRETLKALADDIQWNAVMNCGNQPCGAEIEVNSSRFSIHVEENEGYRVIHLIELDTVVSSSDLLG